MQAAIMNLMDNTASLETKIKRHEDNLKFLNSQANHLDESILDLQVSLARYHSDVSKADNVYGAYHSEEETVAQILQKENSAASILCSAESHDFSQTTKSALTKDVVGVVATLAWVDNDNLSRTLSEFLGLETMLAIVSRTSEGAKALESYDGEGIISCTDGLHGFGSLIGRKINGRFLVICLDELRQYVGGLVADDPQKRLAISKPKLPNGEDPPGFLGYAVNLINLDTRNLHFITANGHGLRETLFYSLFSCLQVYRSRKEMLLALPCITDGALSLDGGMIKDSGVFVLGSRKNVEVKFAVTSGSPDCTCKLHSN
ncbi:protein DEFECTIVE IN MERISTEM SILENCING 3-like [Quillaja saponaria]|uniref:Protein DEFECTIVE IN MERISTEM SILENCING 3-like n=1 Tax=Quillaja saponaria TaxID=32244 RepID=A0AAD7PPQ8_QUISA|nr:protein DEFECTIVE IN MERISTEM SILENCING 3-like [Quillaja saponaria]